MNHHSLSCTNSNDQINNPYDVVEEHNQWSQFIIKVIAEPVRRREETYISLRKVFISILCSSFTEEILPCSDVTDARAASMPSTLVTIVFK